MDASKETTWSWWVNINFLGVSETVYYFQSRPDQSNSAPSDLTGSIRTI